MRTLTYMIFCISLFCAQSVVAEDVQTPREIAQLTYDRYLGDDMQMIGKMELFSKKGQVRSREFISTRKDVGATRKQVIKFTNPADIEGTAFLNIEQDDSKDVEQHLYLPALKRTRRIVASQKSRRFVNSDFTYEDMQRHAVDAWLYQLDGLQEVLSRSCYVLISMPKPDTDTQYSKIISWVDKEYYMPLKTDFYDKKGRHAKQYQVHAYEVVDTIATETDVLMVDLQNEHKTRLTTLKIKYNSGLKDALFTARALER